MTRIQTRLRDHFDEIFELHIPQRESKINTQLAEGEVTTQLVVGDPNFHIDVEKPSNWQSSNQSYNYYHCMWKAIRRAKRDGLKNFLWMEDDAWLQPNFDEVFTAAQHEITTLNLTWDMLYLGANHWESTTQLVSPHLLKCSCTLDMHCVAISESVYDSILDFSKEDYLPTNPHLDGVIAYKLHSKKNVYAVYPSIAWQYDGFSFHENREFSRAQNWQHPGRMTQ